MNIKTVIKIVVPVIIVLMAFGAFKWQMSHKPIPKKKQMEKIIPIVRTTSAELVKGYRYQVNGYGTVQPASLVSIVSEVSGKIIWVNEKMKTGGFFKKNEGLYRVDDTAYVAALDAKIASLKSAEYSLQKIEEEATISKKEWEIWNETGGEARNASALVSYGPQLESARAAVKSAESAVVSAKADLAKVLYKAPFNSIVTAETIEHGKIIRVGESAGTLVGTDQFEVYAPIAAKDAVRIGFSDDKSKASDGYIELSEGKNSWKWQVYAERVLPDADSKTGMLKAVLIVDKPFNMKSGNPILPIGVSVNFAINDKSESEIVRIPDGVLREGNVVWVLSEDSKVQIRDVHITEKRNDYVYIDNGLIGGEKIIASNLKGVVDGMSVNTGQNKKTMNDAQEKGKGKRKSGGAE